MTQNRFLKKAQSDVTSVNKPANIPSSKPIPIPSKRKSCKTDSEYLSDSSVSSAANSPENAEIEIGNPNDHTINKEKKYGLFLMRRNSKEFKNEKAKLLDVTKVGDPNLSPKVSK